MPILDSVPTEFVAGDTVRFTLDLTDYPAPTWDVTFYAENKDKTFSQAAVDEGSKHAFTITAVATAALPLGRYLWRLRATNGAIVETFSDHGWLEILLDPAAAGTHDTRSPARKLLDAVQATLQGRATRDQLSMSLAGRSLSRTPLRELIEWETQLKSQVKTEEAGENAGLGRNIYVRYT